MEFGSNAAEYSRPPHNPEAERVRHLAMETFRRGRCRRRLLAARTRVWQSRGAHLDQDSGYTYHLLAPRTGRHAYSDAWDQPIQLVRDFGHGGYATVATIVPPTEFADAIVLVSDRVNDPDDLTKTLTLVENINYNSQLIKHPSRPPFTNM